MTGSAVLSLHVKDEAVLAAFAQRMAALVIDGGVIHLRGELGAGKTTFARALLQALGIFSRIKSPTYSLIESYCAGDLAVHHLDLYRIADPGELEWLGLADLAIGKYLMLVEWPERAGQGLPLPDLTIALSHAPVGRNMQVTAHSLQAAGWLAAFASN